MSYPPEHKHRTRERILTQARRLFRRHGYDGVGIDAIMNAANLTRGGFYAHFASKEDLFREVVGDHMLAATLRERDRRVSGDDTRWARTVFDFYLSRWHRDAIEDGCSLAALASSVARSGDDVRAVFTDGVRETVAQIADLVPEDGGAGGEQRRSRAIAALALGVGSLLLSRAVNDPRLAAEIIAAGREQVDRIGWPGPDGRSAPSDGVPGTGPQDDVRHGERAAPIRRAAGGRGR